MTPTTALGLSIRLSMFELRETGDWDVFPGPPERARAETGGADQWVLKWRECSGFARVNKVTSASLGYPLSVFNKNSTLKKTRTKQHHGTSSEVVFGETACRRSTWTWDESWLQQLWHDVSVFTTATRNWNSAWVVMVIQMYACITFNDDRKLLCMGGLTTWDSGLCTVRHGMVPGFDFTWDHLEKYRVCFDEIQDCMAGILSPRTTIWCSCMKTSWISPLF